VRKLKIGLVCLRADNFDGGLTINFEASINKLKEYANTLEFDFFYYPELVLNPDDASAACGMIKTQEPDFLMIQLTAFPSGEALIRLAKSCKRIGIWGIPESSYEGSNFVNSNNSFCGMNMACSIAGSYLKGLSIDYKWFFGYADDERFLKRFSLTARALGAIKKMASSRVAHIGGIAPGFNDLYSDERLCMTRLNTEIQRGHEFSEIYDRAHSYSDRDIEEYSDGYACTKCSPDVKKEELVMAARYYKALKEFAAEHKYDALAVSCWPQIKPDTLACSIFGKLNQDCIPVSCEGDLPGVISMLMLHYITKNPATIMDMCGIDEQDETVLMWHCGPSPEFYADANGAATTCSYQLNLAGETIRYPLIHDLILKPGPVTFMRITGEWDKMFLLSGNAIDYPKQSPDGSRGWIGGLKLNGKPVGTLDLANTIMTHGFQHHYPMMAGDIANVCMEIASWLNLETMDTVYYEDYRQVRKY